MMVALHIPFAAPELRRSLRVTFVNQAGAEEAGYGEGVVREFFQQLIRTAFEPPRGLFKLTSDSKLYPNPSASMLFSNVRQHFIFLGRLLGKVSNSIIIYCFNVLA